MATAKTLISSTTDLKNSVVVMHTMKKKMQSTMSGGML